MHAITITKKGAPSVLKVLEYPDPSVGPSDVRIRVRAAGLNFAEISARQGLYPDAPKIPCVVGYEVAGVVDEVGAAVTRVKVGDRVMAMTRFGGHATVVCSHEDFVFKIPDTMSFTQGAAMPVNYLTAHHMLFYIGNVHPRSSILLHMAAGGVGVAVLQLLRGIEGLQIFGTASAKKHDTLRKLGVTRPIDYRTESYVDVVKTATHGRGVDIVLDPLGGEDWKKSLSLLAPAGRAVAFGFANGIQGQTLSRWRLINQISKVPFFTPLAAMDANRSLQGVNMGHMWTEAAVLRPQMERIIRLFEEGLVEPHIHAEVPFSRAAEAHTMLETGANVGKVVLIPD